MAIGNITTRGVNLDSLLSSCSIGQQSVNQICGGTGDSHLIISTLVCEHYRDILDNFFEWLFGPVVESSDSQQKLDIICQIVVETRIV